MASGYWKRQRSSDSPWFHNRWLHGLSSDQERTYFADGNWKHTMNYSHQRGRAPHWAKKQQHYKRVILHWARALVQQEPSQAASQERDSPWITQPSAQFTNNQSLCPSGTRKHTQGKATRGLNAPGQVKTRIQWKFKEDLLINPSSCVLKAGCLCTHSTHFYLKKSTSLCAAKLPTRTYFSWSAFALQSYC